MFTAKPSIEYNLSVEYKLQVGRWHNISICQAGHQGSSPTCVICFRQVGYATGMFRTCPAMCRIYVIMHVKYSRLSVVSVGHSAPVVVSVRLYFVYMAMSRGATMAQSNELT